jgi:CRP-like cAMP-binding protein
MDASREMAIHSTRLDALARTKLFGRLEETVLAVIADALDEVSFNVGKTIFLRGDKGNAIYIVLEGRVRLSVLSPAGRELSFTHALPGDVFGEIAVLDRSPRSADATALSDVRTLVLSASETERLVARFPTLAWAFLQFLCSRLRDVSDHLEHIALLPLEARLARYLLDKVGSAITTGSASEFALGMSQTELALLLGASRQKLNLALMSLEQAGAFKRTAAIYSCNIARLRQFAELD